MLNAEICENLNNVCEIYVYAFIFFFPGEGVRRIPQIFKGGDGNPINVEKHSSNGTQNFSLSLNHVISSLSNHILG